MKKTITLIIVAIFLAMQTKSQTTEITHGWYQVLSGAQVKVIQGNSDDVSLKTDWSAISFSANEVLLVFNFSKDKYYCYDPEGRIVIVKGKAGLKPITATGRPGHILQEVKIGLDLVLNVGNNVWLVGFNAANKTAKILMADGSVQEIPQDFIQDLKDYMDLMDKFTDWHTAE